MAWQIDSAHSEVTFSVRHMMIAKVRGRFATFTGSVHFDEQNPAASTVDVKIDADSIDTKQDQRDGHLRSADFLDVANHPHLEFKSSRVEVLDDSHANVYGDLTIRGVTKPVVLEVEYQGQAKSPWGTTSAGFSAETKISRKEWGLNWNQPLETGGVLVGDEVTINIELEIVKQPEEDAVEVATA
jgi:polyisoprenoid-binding protein YceI